jgi:purine-binding chemotaxis protein CheW
MKFDFLSTDTITKRFKLIGFSINNVNYGLDIMGVREIINAGKLVEVPGMPSFIKGVADHRNEVVPIIGLRKRFGLAEVDRTRRTKWILLKRENNDIGLEVDLVTQVIVVDPEQRQDTVIVGEAEDRRWVLGTYQLSDGIIFELNVDEVIGTAAKDPGPAHI